MIVTRANENGLIRAIKVSPIWFSDHFYIAFRMQAKKPRCQKKILTVRNLKNINMEEVADDITQSVLLTNTPTDLDDLVHCYNTTLSQTLDKHAPATTKEVIVRPHTPWFSDSIKTAKQERRRAERKWNKSKSPADREALKGKQKAFNDICEEAKTEYYSNTVNRTQRNSKELFQVANTLLCKKKSDTLPSHTSKLDLANDLKTFFKEKIGTLRGTFSGENPNNAQTEDEFKGTCLNEFIDLSQEELSAIIQKSSSASCVLDPMPTSIVKNLLPTLLPIIQNIVNKSLTEKKMPTALKEAIVKPLLKKPSLDKEDFKNYRPVSNLAFLGKVIEKAAIQQIDQHISNNNLHEPLQSAYTKNHSTETALLKVSNDILRALDKGKGVYMVLLDLSAAFDTIDHTVFLSRLEKVYGVTGGVAEWMQSYLSDRHQSISIDGTLSDRSSLDFGFPQGSALGPFGFKLYTNPSLP